MIAKRITYSQTPFTVRIHPQCDHSLLRSLHYFQMSPTWTGVHGFIVNGYIYRVISLQERMLSLWRMATVFVGPAPPWRIIRSPRTKPILRWNSNRAALGALASPRETSIWTIFPSAMTPGWLNLQFKDDEFAVHSEPQNVLMFTYNFAQTHPQEHYGDIPLIIKRTMEPHQCITFTFLVFSENSNQNTTNVLEPDITNSWYASKRYCYWSVSTVGVVLICYIQLGGSLLRKCVTAQNKRTDTKHRLEKS